ELVVVRDRLGGPVGVVVVGILLGGAVPEVEVGAHRVAVGDRRTRALDQGGDGGRLRSVPRGVPRRGELLAHVAAEGDGLQLARRAGAGRRSRLRVGAGVLPGTA